MVKDDYYYLGKITKVFGYKGDLIFYFDVDDISEYQTLDSVFIDVNGDLIPFLIDKLTPHKGNNAIVRLQDFNSIDEAQRLINCDLYLPLSTLPKLEGNKFYYHEIIGFTVVDAKDGEIGVIKNVNDQTAQVLFEIKDGDREILFPVVDELIDKLDRENKRIYVRFPEGLLDLYL